MTAGGMGVLILDSSITLPEEEIPKRSQARRDKRVYWSVTGGPHTDAPEPGAQLPSSPSAASASWVSSAPSSCRVNSSMIMSSELAEAARGTAG